MSKVTLELTEKQLGVLLCAIDLADRGELTWWANASESTINKTKRNMKALMKHATCRHAFLEERNFGEQYRCMDCGVEIEGDN